MPKELIFPAKNTFQLADCQDIPLAPNEIRGATLCTLVSQGTELAWAAGDDFPIRPGYAAVFRVDEIGADVTGISTGDIRFCMGAHRSTQTYDPRFTLPVPDGMAPELAVIARLMGVSMTTLMTTEARAGDKVIIAGAGPVGLLAAQNFRIAGYDVAVVEPDATRRAQATQMGISRTFAAMPHDDPSYAKKVAIVVDCSGHEASILDACNIVRQGGEVVLVGVPWRAMTDILAHEILNSVFFNFVHLRSGWEWRLPITGRGFVWEELLEGYNNAAHSIMDGFEKAFVWLDSGLIDISNLMTIRSPADPSALYDEIQTRQITTPFIALDWTKDD